MVGVDDLLAWLWGQLSYVLALLAGCGLVAKQMTAREHFMWRAVFSSVGILVIKMLLDLLLVQNMEPGTCRTMVNLSLSVLLLVLIMLATTWCYKCDLFAGMFCSTIGYGMQHVAHRLFMMYCYLDTQRDFWVSAAILTIITVLVYFLIYWALLKRVRFYHVIVDNKLQIAITTIFIVSIIFLGQFILNNAVDTFHRVQIILFTIGACMLGVMLELSNMSSKNYEMQRDLSSRLRTEEKDKYHTDRAVIELLNIKAHDLKHQLAVSGGELNEEALRETQQILGKYEEIVQTGNKALDAILTHKIRQAASKNIKITYLVDGEKLSFISDIDVYSLLGNILDNAIEAVKKVDDPEKRIISIVVSTRGYFVSISTSNYYTGTLELVDGLPRTTKADRIYHGFGLQSIKMLAEKYHGNLKIVTKGDIFILDILFPL